MTQSAAISLTTPSYSPQGLSRRAQRLVHEFIMTHLGERVGLDDLAQVSGLSRFHFCRLFRKSTGHSPMRYLQLCRLEYAKRLLARGTLTMAEIAVLSGFCDQSHLCRSFRKFIGVTPREFAHGSLPCSVRCSHPDDLHQDAAPGTGVLSPASFKDPAPAPASSHASSTE